MQRESHAWTATGQGGRACCARRRREGIAVALRAQAAVQAVRGPVRQRAAQRIPKRLLRPRRLPVEDAPLGDVAEFDGVARRVDEGRRPLGSRLPLWVEDLEVCAVPAVARELCTHAQVDSKRGAPHRVAAARAVGARLVRASSREHTWPAARLELLEDGVVRHLG